jgi:hypothetical protein
MRTALALLVIAAVDRFSSGWTRRRALSFAAFLVVGWFVAGTVADGLVAWLLGGAVAGLVLWGAYAFVLRFDPALAPLAVAGATVLTTLREGLRGGYPEALTGSIVAAVLVGAAALLWLRALSGASGPAPSSAPTGVR